MESVPEAGDGRQTQGAKWGLQASNQYFDIARLSDEPLNRLLEQPLSVL
jgi:hypothetical protein